MRAFILFLVILVGFDQAVGISLDALYRRTTSGELGGLINLALKQSPDILVLGSSRAVHHVSPSVLRTGLSASVFSQDINRALKVAMRINTGICHINGATVADEAQMPFGGVKASGYGRFGGKAGIAEFTDLRWITIETGEPHYPF